MSCAKSVLPVFMTKPSPRDRREEPPDIQIRPSNELSESFMHQWIPRKCHSPNRTVVVGFRAMQPQPPVTNVDYYWRHQHYHHRHYEHHQWRYYN